MGRSGAPVVEPPELSAGVEMAGALMDILGLLCDPAKLAAAVKSLDEAVSVYRDIKVEVEGARAALDRARAEHEAASEEQRSRLAGMVASATALQDEAAARTAALAAREDALAAREAKMRAALE